MNLEHETRRRHDCIFILNLDVTMYSVFGTKSIKVQITLLFLISSEETYLSAKAHLSQKENSFLPKHQMALVFQSISK